MFVLLLLLHWAGTGHSSRAQCNSVATKLRRSSFFEDFWPKIHLLLKIFDSLNILEEIPILEGQIPKNVRLQSIFQIRRFFVFGPFSIFVATLAAPKLSVCEWNKYSFQHHPKSNKIQLGYNSGVIHVHLAWCIRGIIKTSIITLWCSSHTTQRLHWFIL